MVSGISRRSLWALAASALLPGEETRPADTGAALPDAPFTLESGWRSLLNGRDLNGWRSLAAWRGDANHLDEWKTTRAVTWHRIYTPITLAAKPEPGPIIVNGIDRHTSNLITEEDFGDIELYLEFMVPKGSNSGVYLHGLYEVQIFDSWGAPETPGTGDSGAIYERWENGRGFEGSPPLVNASRPPGQWQAFHIWFRAPKFEGGRKTANAEFVQVAYNGLVVQRRAQCTGPTRSALERPESARNPILLQGDHGPVAFRNIYVRPLRQPGSAPA